MGGVDPGAAWGPNSEGGVNATIAAAGAGVSGAQYALASGAFANTNRYPVGSQAWYNYEITLRNATAQATTQRMPGSANVGYGQGPVQPAPVGSQGWYQQQISQREATARATTVANPGYANTLAGDIINRGVNLTPQQAANINYMHAVTSEQAALAFSDRQSNAPISSKGLPKGVEFTGYIATKMKDLPQSIMLPAPFKSTIKSDADKATDAALWGLPVAAYGVGQAIQKPITDTSDELYNKFAASPSPGGYNPFTTAVENVKTLGNIEVGAWSAIAGVATLPFVLPYAAAWSAYHPKEVPAKAVEIVKGMASTMWEREQKSPGSLLGTAVGMWAGGKVIGYGVGKVGKLNPVKLETADILTGKGPVSPGATDVWVQSKLSGSPVIQGFVDQLGIIDEFPSSNKYTYLRVGGSTQKPSFILGGVGYGSEVKPQVFIGRTGLENILSGTHIERATDLYQTLPKPWSNAEKVVLQPFFTKTAVDPFTAEVANLNDNLARARANLNGKYVPYQLIGTAPQMDLTFDQSVGLQKMMMMGKGSTQYYGSRSLVDVIGEPYYRDVSASDIDANTGLDIANAQMKRAKEIFKGSQYGVNKNTLYDADMIVKNPKQPNYLGPNKEIIGNLKNIKYQMKPEEKPGAYVKIKQNAGPWNNLNDRGFYVGAGGDKAVFGTHPTETGTEIQTMPMPNIAGGITNVQIPTDFILTKAGKTIGRGGNANANAKGAVFRYDPKTGKTRVNTVGGKQDTNLIDIYAASRYIAKTASDNHLYDLAKTFEQTSEAVGLRLKNKLKIDIKDKIQEDILEGVPRSKPKLSQIMGVGLTGFMGLPDKVEVYPSSLPKTPKNRSGILPFGYPTGITKGQHKGSATISYPGYIGSKPTISKMVIPLPYPTGKVTHIPRDNYPVGKPTISKGIIPIPYPTGRVTYTPGKTPVYPTGKVTIPHDNYPVSKITIPKRHPVPERYPGSKITIPKRIIPVQQVITLPQDISSKTRVKRKQEKGKRFAEVFSLVKYPGFKVPGRAKVKNYKSTGKKFGETFSLAVGRKVKRRKQK
jgi:hypothetical protein